MNRTLPTDGEISHGDRVLAYYIFLDVVGFTLKLEAVQSRIIEHLNKIVRDSVREQDIPESQKMFLPTGDGICIVLIGVLEEPAVDLKIARGILKHIRNYNATNSAHRFDVRIGINDNLDTLVADINNRQNIAGEGINIACRIMSLADGFQILVSSRAYDRLNPHVGTHRFKSLPARLKHGIPHLVYQYLGDEDEELVNISTPSKLLLSQTELAFPTARQCEAITGQWKGQVKQRKGKHIQFEIDLELKMMGLEIGGSGRFEWRGKDILLRITRGWFSHGDFVRLDYEDKNSRILRYGTMLFELVPAQEGTQLNGFFVGYAPEAKAIIAGPIDLLKQE